MIRLILVIVFGCELTLVAEPASNPFAIAVSAPDTLPAGPGAFDARVEVSADAPTGVSAHLNVEFTDDRERVFWRTDRQVRLDAGRSNRFDLRVAHPALPTGQYFLNAWLTDERGQPWGDPLPPISDALGVWFGSERHRQVKLPSSAVRRPIARMRRFDFDRDLLWATWDHRPLTPAQSAGLRAAGINVGTRFDYHFRYRWFVDHAAMHATGVWGHDALEDLKQANLDWYSDWVRWTRHDPGFVMMDMCDELPFNRDPVRLRANQLIHWRINPQFPAVPTISKFNQAMRTDCLGWDEVARPGFPGPQGPDAVKLDWAMALYTNEFLQLRMELVRRHNPYAVLTPGMGAGLLDNFYDAMHSRAYKSYSTLHQFATFLPGLSRYGDRPWTWLLSLKPPLEEFSRISWASLACNGRMFPIYCPGDAYGDRIIDAEGNLTPSGVIFKQVRDRIDPLKPVLLGTRTRIEPDVLYWDPAWAYPDSAFFEGLLVCGVMPDSGRDTANRKLLVVHGASYGVDAQAVRRAVELGALLIAAPATAAPVAQAFGLKRPAVAALAGKPDAQVDLSPLSSLFGRLAGIIVRGEPGPEGELTDPSELRAVVAGGRTIAWMGKVGQGRALFLNVTPALDRAASGELMRALLDEAGVPERYRFTDDAGRFHPGVLGSSAQTFDGSARYVVITTEADADVQARMICADPAVRAVRDLCEGRTLPWRQAGETRYVELNLPKGVGTMLALLGEAPKPGRLSVTASPTCRPGQTLSVQVLRQDDAGQPLTGAHSYRLRIRDADGEVLPGMDAWHTGPSPWVLTLPVALNDPAGRWEIQAENLTDGAAAATDVLCSTSPALTDEWSMPDPVLRGRAQTAKVALTNHSADALELSTLWAACDEPGVALRVVASPKVLPPNQGAEVEVVVEVAPETAGKRALLRLGVGEKTLAASALDLPAALEVELDPTPTFNAEVCLVSVRGRVRTSLAEAPRARINIGVPAAVMLDPTAPVVEPRSDQPAEFELALVLSRQQLIELLGPRREGVVVTVAAPGFESSARWVPPVSPFPRQPPVVGSVEGGSLALGVDNRTTVSRRLTLELAGLPGWAEQRIALAGDIPAGQTMSLTHEVHWSDPTAMDPGFHWIDLKAVVDDRAFDLGQLLVEQQAQQQWWIRHVTADQADDELLKEVFSQSAAALERSGWRRVVIGTVLWWDELARLCGAPKEGRLLAVTRAHSRRERVVEVGSVGSARPGLILFNEAACHDQPVAARLPAGASPLAVVMDLNNLKPGGGAAIVIRDPADQTRLRDLRWQW